MYEITKLIKRSCSTTILILIFVILLLLIVIFQDIVIIFITWFPNNILAVATVMLVIVTGVYSYVNIKTMWYKALLNAENEHRSHEMMVALHTLWTFYKKDCKEREDTLKEKYEAQITKEEDNIYKEKDNEKKKKLIQNSLSYQRRVVYSFYAHLYHLYKYKILNKKMIFSYWHKNNLEIIPKILIPIHMVQVKHDKSIDKEIAQKQLDKLQELYDESKQY